VFAKVQQLSQARAALEGGGFKIRRPNLPDESNSLGGLLLLWDHLVDHFQPGQSFPGGPHPHRGFITVSYLLQGSLNHKCSSGAKGVQTPGHVQWMTAGRGVVHSGGSTAEFQAHGGDAEGFQIWINLPRKDKMIPPNYQDLEPENIPWTPLGSRGSSVKVISGSFGNLTGACRTHTPMTFLDFRLMPGEAVDVPIPRNHVALVYVFRGNGQIGDASLTQFSTAILTRDTKGEQTLRLVCPESAALVNTPAAHAKPSESREHALKGISLFQPAGLAAIVFHGLPLEEPIARQGPFVMNTAEEIRQAWTDYHNGVIERESRSGSGSADGHSEL